MKTHAKEFRERQAQQLRWPRATEDHGQLPSANSRSELVTIENVESALASRGVRFTRLGLEIPETLDMAGWIAIGTKICKVNQTIEWWEGDWVRFGLWKFECVQEGNAQHPTSDIQHPTAKAQHVTLKEFALRQGAEYQTLRNRAWVASSFDLSRRRDKVPWYKYEVIAKLSIPEQEKWLDLIEAKNMSRAELRRNVQLSQGEENALASDGPALESARKHLDAFMARVKGLPDPGGPDPFWDAERRDAWRGWLRPVVEFAGKLERDVIRDA